MKKYEVEANDINIHNSLIDDKLENKEYLSSLIRLISNIDEMNKAKKAKVTQKEAAEVLSGLVEVVQKTVSKGEKVTLVGFGTFEARKRAARTGRNPQTGKEIKIAAKTVPAFSAGKKFKELVNKK